MEHCFCMEEVAALQGFQFCCRRIPLLEMPALNPQKAAGIHQPNVAV